MKKKVSFLLACAMLAGSALGMFGCSDNDNPTSEEVFVATKQSIEKFSNYDGPMTIQMTSSLKLPIGETTMEVVATKTSSFDKATERAYTVVDNETYAYTKVDNETKREFQSGSIETEKFYKKNGAYYLFESEAEKTADGVGSPEKTAEKVHVSKLQSLIDDVTADSGEMSEAIWFMDRADSFEELKTAFTTVYAEQGAQKKLTDAGADASATVTHETKDGVSSIKVETKTRQSTVEESVVVGATDIIITIELQVKGSQLVGYSILAEGIGTKGAGETLVKEEMAIGMTAKIEYAFNQNVYNSIETDETNATDYSSQVSKKLKIHAFNEESNYLLNGTVGENAQNIISPILLGYEEAHTTIEWFTDANYTQPLDLTGATIDNLAITDVYGRVSVEDGYALVYYDDDIIDNRSKNYQIVFASQGGSERYETPYSHQITGNDAQDTFTIEAIANYGVKLDGKVLSSEEMTFVLKNKTCYIVSYCTILQDADYNVFEDNILNQ